MIIAVIALCIATFAGGKFSAEFNRGPTQEELDRAATEEVALRWRSWSAGEIFPASLGYATELGGNETATRIGIAQGTKCGTALENELVRGCAGVLRATYLDALGGVAITMGVVSYRDARPSGLAGSGKLRALAVPGTAAARFDDAARQAASHQQAGPYLILTTTGYADGRPKAKTKRAQGDLFTIGSQLAAKLAGPLSARAKPRCAAKGWSC